LRSPRFRITIGHMMAATLVVALALAPIPATLRTPTPEFVVATGAYEVVFLPVVVALIAMAMMPPGRERTVVIVALCATPVLLLVGLVVASYALALVLAAVQVVIGPGPLAPRVFFCAWFSLTTYFLVRRLPRRCPSCRTRFLRQLSRPVPEVRAWVPSGVFKCDRCGRCYRPVRSGLFVRMVPEEPPAPD
jgi:hypothetical protein